MKKSRFSEEQIIGILKEQQAGLPVAEVCRKHSISDATFYTWRLRSKDRDGRITMAMSLSSSPLVARSDWSRKSSIWGHLR